MQAVSHTANRALIFTTAGGMGPTASVVFQRLASLFSAKRNEHYSKTTLFIRMMSDWFRPTTLSNTLSSRFKIKIYS